MQIPINYVVGKWVVQKTMYNLLLDKAMNIKSNNLIKQTVNNNPYNNFYLENTINNQIVSISLDLKTRKETINFNNIVVLNNYNQNFIKKYCYVDISQILTISCKCSKISIVEKFWPISQNLLLSISIIQYKTNIVSIIFESKIRT